MWETQWISQFVNTKANDKFEIQSKLAIPLSKLHLFIAVLFDWVYYYYSIITITLGSFKNEKKKRFLFLRIWLDFFPSIFLLIYTYKTDPVRLWISICTVIQPPGGLNFEFEFWFWGFRNSGSAEATVFLGFLHQLRPLRVHSGSWAA